MADALVVIGLGAVVYGVALMYAPAGWCLAGVCLVGLGIALERRPRPAEGPS